MLGDALYYLAYPDWCESQSRAVRSVCSSPESDVWVAILDGRLVGFVASEIKFASDPLAGEIEMIAVDPEKQQLGNCDSGSFRARAINHLHEAGVSLVEIASGGDVAHAPARLLYENAGFRALPLVRYYRRP